MSYQQADPTFESLIAPYELSAIEKKLALRFFEAHKKEPEKLYAFSHNLDELNMMELRTFYRWQNGDLQAKPKYMPTLHSHSFYEILFVEKGDPQYIIQDKRIQVHSHDVILLPPGTVHQVLNPENTQKSIQPYERHILWLNADYFSSLTLIYPEMAYCFQECQRLSRFVYQLPIAEASLLENLCASLRKETDTERFAWEMAYENKILQFLLTLNRILYYQDIHASRPETNQLSDHVRSFIDTHYHQKLTINDIAKAMHVSTSTISHSFCQDTGCTCYQYLLQKRLVETKKGILSGTPIKVIWEKCGFCDYSSFYRAFLKAYGVSPRNYRNGFW